MEPPDVDYGYSSYGCCEDCDGYTSEPEEEIVEYHGHEYDYESTDRRYGDDAVQFDKMWPAVKEICRSLVEDPDDWEQTRYTILHKPTKMMYWTGTGSGAITDSYVDSNAERVFSEVQGKEIREALLDRDIIQPTPAQLAVMRALKTVPQPHKPEPGFFGRMWAAIKFFPTMAIFCLKYKSQ